jgi:hypothetical protein
VPVPTVWSTLIVTEPAPGPPGSKARDHALHLGIGRAVIGGDERLTFGEGLAGRDGEGLGAHADRDRSGAERIGAWSGERRRRSCFSPKRKRLDLLCLLVLFDLEGRPRVGVCVGEIVEVVARVAAAGRLGERGRLGDHGVPL